jgi:hypothetical protein
LIVAVDVLDQVDNDVPVLTDCRRTLRDGGWLIAPVVIDDSRATQELDERRVDGRIRLAGVDYSARIMAQGFVPVATFDPLDQRYAGLDARHNIRPPGCRPGSHAVVIFQKDSLPAVTSVHQIGPPRKWRSGLVGRRERERNAETASTAAVAAAAAARN